MRALVTGATGLVGSRLAGRLIERRDVTKALVRDHTKGKSLANMGVTLAQGDLRDPQSLQAAMENFDVVYHCAAQVALPHQGNREHLIKTNVEGTKNLLEAAIQASVKRFVFVSSVAVYGGLSEIGIEENAPHRANGYYSESKILAEKTVRELEEKSKIEVVILRPCVIYGPGDLNFLPRIMELLLKGRFPLVSGGAQLLDLVYVDDVVDALLLAGTRTNAAGQAYNVTDGATRTLREIIDMLSRVLGQPLKTIRVPYTLALAFSALSVAWSRLAHPSEEPLISPLAVRTMNRPHHYSIKKIRDELEYEPKISLEHGLERTLSWYYDWKGRRLGHQHSWQGGF